MVGGRFGATPNVADWWHRKRSRQSCRVKENVVNFVCDGSINDQKHLDDIHAIFSYKLKVDHH